MDGSLTVLLMMVAVAAAIAWWHHHGGGRRVRNPIGFAFSATAAAALFLITGAIGFGLQKGPALLSPARWPGGVIWPQVWLGLAIVPIAVLAWIRAIRYTDRLLEQQ